jgi:hypothetical protein
MELTLTRDPQRLCAPDDPERQTVFRSSWVSGERTEPIVIAEVVYVHLIGIRLRAGGAWPFLGVPLREFSDRVVELDTILGREADELRDRLGEAPNEDAQLDLAEAWPRQRMRSRTPPTVRGESCAGNYSTGSEHGADRPDGGRDWDQP